MSDVVTWKVEAAFTTDPLDPSPVWEDLSDRLRAFPGFSSNRGKSGEFQEVETGTCTIPLDNQDGELTPANTSGTWFGQLLPNRLCRISATYNAVEHWQFTGLIEAYEQIVGPGSPDQICLLRVADGFKILNLERVPPYPDYPDEVERLLDPVWGYWRLNGKPSTKVRPGGWVKKKDNKDKDKKPQKKWRKARKQRWLASASGPEAQVFGKPQFLQSSGEWPIAGELTYGMRFGENQWLRVPCRDLGDRPGAEDALTVAFMFKPGPSFSDSGTIISGPLSATVSAPAWFVVDGIDNELEFLINRNAGIVNFQTVQTANDVFARDGTWYHVVCTWREDSNVMAIFVDGDRKVVGTEVSGGAGGGMRRGDAGEPLFIAGDATFSGEGGSRCTLAEVVISDRKFTDDETQPDIEALYRATVAGFGSPANLPASGGRIEAILDGISAANYPASYFTSARRDIDPGETSVLPQRLDETKLELLRRVEEAENGLLFVATDGTLTFHDNTWLETGAGTDVFCTLASDGIGIDFQGIAPETNDDMLWPVVTVTREGGEPQTAGDPTAFFGQPQEIGDTLHTTDDAAMDLAEKLQQRFGQSHNRITSLTLNALSNPLLYPIVLGAELGYRVVVEHTYPNGTVETFDTRIIGIQRNSQGVEHTATWTLAPSYAPGTNEWYLGVPDFSELGVATTLA